MAKPNPYAERNRLVRRLGFTSYADYLKSRLWADIRARVMERDRRRCVMEHSGEGCACQATEVHHRRYDLLTLMGGDLSGLVAVCRTHHQQAEYGRDGKRTLAQANNFLGVGRRMRCWLCDGKFTDTVMMPRGSGGIQTACPECYGAWLAFQHDRRAT